MWEVKKNFKISVAAKRVKLWLLNANFSLRTKPVYWIHLIGPLEPYLAEKISLQSSNCNILGLAATVAFFANEAPFTQI